MVMAENFDSDVLTGFKRSISQLSEVENAQQIVQVQHLARIVDSAEKGPETEPNNPLCASQSSIGFQKKAKCTSSGDSEDNVAVPEKQETEDVKKLMIDNGDGVVGERGFQLASEKEKELKICELGLSGNQELDEVKKTSSSVVSLQEVRMPPVVGDWKTDFATSRVSFLENECESFLGNKVEQRLVEQSAGSIADGMTHASKFTDFESEREIMRHSIKIKEELDNLSRVDEKFETVEIPDTYGKGSVCEGIHKIVESHSEKVGGPKSNGETMTCSLKIEVIDETAVIESTSASGVGNGNGMEKGRVGFAKHSERNGQKNVMKQETYEKKEKGRRRRGKGAKKVSWTSEMEKIPTRTAESQMVSRKKGDETKRTYSREDMEVLRFANLEAQRKKWIEVYCGLVPNVAREYDGLIDFNIQKHIHINFDPRQQFGKQKNHGILGEDCIQVMNGPEDVNRLDPACGPSISGEDDYTVVDEEYNEEDDSDDDYSSIQRPAFLVTGEPNFDSGPPLDGLEYLRRVRWEAAHIPKVKVAKLERSKLNKEQTVYMPKIPDIAKCPEHLLPLRQWEDAFIADFSELRLAVSRLEDCRAEVAAQFQFSSTVHEDESSHQLLEKIIVEKIDKLDIDGIESYEAPDCSMADNSSDTQSVSSSTVDENNASPSLENSNSKSLATGRSSDAPTLSLVLKMDSVARLSMLRKRISLVENMSTLSRNDCTWLFALCTVIDTPLNADTCAALRCLLRKCASLRAEKSEVDDEVVMLNILATIAGKYFGQSEH